MSQVRIRPVFAPAEEFGRAIKAIETDFFRKDNSAGRIKTGDWRLWHKAIILLTLFFSIYWVLVFTHSVYWLKILLCLALGAVTASVGFNVGHDANHGSFHKRPWINNLMRLSFNLYGIFSFFWRVKHNVLHHTYTNIDGVDEDISGVKQLRMHPDQPWRSMHRFQAFYCWFLYGLLHIGWFYVNDFKKYFNGHIGGQRNNMKNIDHLNFWMTKIFYITFFCVVPWVILGFKTWIVGYLVYEFSVGLITSTVFQLAHVVEKTSQPTVMVATEDEWRLHEVLTTANFGMQNKVLSWLVGGLNFQIEHHLFPKVSHVHYLVLSKEVQKACEAYKVPYNSYVSFWSGLKSHTRKMAELGKRPVLSLTT